MNHIQAEKKFYLRSPLIWTLLGVMSLLFGWGFLFLVELFQGSQASFAGMSDAPTVLDAVVLQTLQWQVKLLIVLSSVIGGLSYSRWFQTQFKYFFLQSQQSVLKWMWSKFLVAFLMILIFSLPGWLQMLWLIIKVEEFQLRLIWVMIGWLLLVIWMLSVTQLISAVARNTAFAILLSLMLLGLLWLLGFSTTDASWGKNWIQALSPSYHFQQFLSGRLPLSSISYFLLDTLAVWWILHIVLKAERSRL